MPRYWSAVFIFLALLVSICAAFLGRLDLVVVALLVALLGALVEGLDPSRKGRSR